MNYKTHFVKVCIIVVGCISFSYTKLAAQEGYRYQPDDQKLYDTIVRLDSIFFHAYNTCAVNLEKYASFYADSLEFYHDRNGLANSKKEIVAGTQKYICGKVTRELVRGSVEVYPIKDYGAIEIGLHRFHNSAEPNAAARPSKFIIFWQKIRGEWKISKVVSLH